MIVASESHTRMDLRLPVHRYQRLIPASQPHGEMRVLIVLPGRYGSQIICELHHVPIRSPPPYEALSYTWGPTKGKYSIVPAASDHKQMHTIVLDGLFKSIGNSIQVALQHLLDELEARVLWVDALCS